MGEPPSNKALKLPKRDAPSVGALRAPSSLSRASQLSAVLSGRSRLERDEPVQGPMSCPSGG